MGEHIALQVEKREETGRKNSASVRDQGKIPGVLYGKEREPVSIAIDRNGFAAVFEQAGESTLIDLSVDDQPPVKVLIYDFQRDPHGQDVTHVDFYQVKMDEKITAEVEFVFEGTAPIEKEQGGIIVKAMGGIEVECLPADLPHEITVDLSGLQTFDDVIRVQDLPTFEGVEYQANPERTVVTVSEPRSEEELKALEEEVVEDVEGVEVSGEKPEEGAEGAEEGEEAPKEEEQSEENKS